MKAPEEKEEKRMERIARSERKHRALADWLELVTEVMEIAVAVIVLVGFFISIIPILKEMPSLLDNTNAYSFHVFLEHAFNLVIGIEFVRMLIKHTPGSALGVLLFAIAVPTSAQLSDSVPPEVKKISFSFTFRIFASVSWAVLIYCSASTPF